MLIVAGLISFLAGDVCYYILDAMNDTAPFPSIADALYLGMYPLVICGLLRLIRQMLTWSRLGHRCWMLRSPLSARSRCSAFS